VTNFRDNIFYRLNDGVIYIYDVCEAETPGGLNKRFITNGSKFFFEEINIAVDDYESAKHDGAKLTMRIRILRQNQITTEKIARINGKYYGIWRVRNGFNRHYVPITDITLRAEIGNDVDLPQEE